MNDQLVRCPLCAGEFATLYYRFGLPHACPHCGREVVITLRDVKDGRIQPTGVQTTFGELRRLLETADTRAKLQHVVARHLALQPTGADAQSYADAAGQRYTLPEVHERLQTDREAQGAVYNIKMSAWR